MYVIAPNNIFARYKLATRKQKSRESLDGFIEELKKLIKHCGFETVTAKVYHSEMIRDSFINGLCSNYICQRLLENAKSTLDEAYEKARTSHIAQKNSEFSLQQNSQPSLHVAAATVAVDETDPLNRTLETLAAVQKQAVIKKSCYFCGGSLHTNRKSSQPLMLFAITAPRKGILQKFANLKRNQSTSVPSSNPLYVSLLQLVHHVSMPDVVNGIDFTALINSCSSDSFISENAFKRHHIELKTSSKKVSMALMSIESTIVGHCYVTLDLSGHR